MLGQAKPFASLSSGLLARKGQAKPAMRPQGFNNFGSMGGALDDLGWNDMGDGEPTPRPVPTDLVVEAPVALPPVLVAREALKEEVEAPKAVEPASAAPAIDVQPVAPATVARIGREAAKGGKAAFTLRLDAERHLRLRLATAVAGRSAQQLVVQALDAFLTTVPEVEELAVQLDRTAR